MQRDKHIWQNMNCQPRNSNTAPRAMRFLSASRPSACRMRSTCRYVALPDFGKALGLARQVDDGYELCYTSIPV